MTIPPLLKSDASGVQLSIVVPVYKEAGNIRPFLMRSEAVMARMAGILNCTGEKCVVIDVDLQDPPEVIEQLSNKMAEGYEVVYAMRSSREGETLIKRAVSYFGYSVINRLSDVQIPRNTGDFRVMSRRVIEELRRLSESHGFLRGMVAYVGFKQAAVLYKRDARLTGTGNYNRLIGSLRIGINGLVGFSSRPLQVMSMAGFVVAALSFAIGMWYVVQKIVGVDLTPGLPTTVLVVSFFSGVQLLALGVVGEYIGRIYDESKRRPMYIVDRMVNFFALSEGSAAGSAVAEQHPSSKRE
jgi:polyisoprenyl-phosphate glycosyltransferase